MQLIKAKSHYPLSTRILLDHYNSGRLSNVASLIIEPRYGYVGRLLYHNGAVRMFRRTNVGVNNHGAAEMSKDKGYTKFFLQQLGYNTPRGTVFLLPAYHQLIDRKLSRFQFDDYNDLEKIYDYIDNTLGYPVYVKPNDQSQGKGVFRCVDAAGVELAIRAAIDNHDQKIIVEAAVTMPDYRVVIYDGTLICAYGRQPLQIVGDGQQTIHELLGALQATQDAEQRDSYIDPSDLRIAAILLRNNLTPHSILPLGQVLPLADHANLSTGGSAVDVTDQIHSDWVALCVATTQAMGLRLCGVDLACADITDPHADYSIIETNASPGLDNYATLSNTASQRVYELYLQIFNTAP